MELMTSLRLRRDSEWPFRYSTCFHSSPSSTSWMQMAFFTFLPQILLSGFMFPFAGMPKAAQWLAEVLPLTHFLRLARGIMLRNATLAELWVEVLALSVFTLAMLVIAVARVRKRLD